MRLLIVGFLSVFAVTAQASAQTATPSATEAKPAEPEKAKRICRSTQITGQRIPKKICKTEAEWSEDTTRDIDALRMKTAGGSSIR